MRKGPRHQWLKKAIKKRKPEDFPFNYYYKIDMYIRFSTNKKVKSI